MTAQSQALSSRPAAGRPTREQAEARQNQLLDVALDQFLELGFAQTTVEAIAREVGMTKRTIYALYDGKAALFRAAVDRAITRATVPIGQLEALDRDDLSATLRAVAHMRVANVMTEEGLRLQRIINTESYRFPEIFNWSFERTGKPVVEYLTALLAEHQARGSLSLERPDMAANIFMSMVVSGPVRIIVSGNNLSQIEINDRIDFAVRLFLEGAKTR